MFPFQKKKFLGRFARLNFSKKNLGVLDPDDIFADSASALSGDHLDRKIERPIERISFALFVMMVAGGFGYLGMQAVRLQVASGDSFFAKSQENRFLVRPIFPPRGMLYDQEGRALVENIPSFSLVFEKDRFRKQGGDRESLLAGLEKALGAGRDFFIEAGFSESADFDAMPARTVVVRDLDLSTVVRVAAQLADLPGVQIAESYRRNYRSPYAFSHLLGYISKTSEEDLRSRPDLRIEDMIGKSGIEAFYDDALRGKGGKKIIEVDSRGEETRFKFTEEPREGMTLKLSVDGELQEKAYEILDRYVGGAKGASIVAIDPRNGAVRALVSYPGFDINKFASFLPQREFESIVKNPLRPLFNRAIGGEFPSGSVLKPLIAAAALEERLIDPEKKIYDEGFIEIPHPYRLGEKSVFKDWRAHGWVDFYDSIAYSANVYFYMIGGGYRDQQGLGIVNIKRYTEAFGLGRNTGIDMPGERPGFIPDPESKKITEPQNPIWRIGDTYNVSIGQGGVKVTPLQITSALAAVANGGTLWRPHLLEAMLNEEGKIREENTPVVIREQVVSKESVEEVQKGMRRTVTMGTGRILQEVPVPVAAKTGTAQAGSGLPHAWITAYAPYENPEIAITVMVEHAGEGSTVAGPITRDILAWYFGERIRKPRP